jgi:predicted transcriptional regulator
MACDVPSCGIIGLVRKKSSGQETAEKVVDKTTADKKMKKKTRKIIDIGTAEEFFKRSRARAEKIDRSEKIRPEMRLMFEDPADLIRAVSAERIRLILAARLKPGPVSDLALFLKRDLSAVKRDVKILTTMGLLTLHEEPNPGHGRRKIVQPVAEKYELVATI